MYYHHKLVTALVALNTRAIFPLSSGAYQLCPGPKEAFTGLKVTSMAILFAVLLEFRCRF